jgi:hypothetical protein
LEAKDSVRRVPWALACAAFFLAAPASAQHTFKCGNTFQDRPCETQDVQQRFSSTSGTFAVQQVNADTDKECAKFATTVHPYWERIHKGESVDRIKAEMDARPVSRYEKAAMRDVLLALKEFKGNSREVRGEFERMCMDYKRKHGILTETEISANAKAQSAAQARSNANSIEAQARRMEMRNRGEEERLRMEEQQAARALAAASAADARREAREAARQARREARDGWRR